MSYRKYIQTNIFLEFNKIKMTTGHHAKNWQQFQRIMRVPPPRTPLTVSDTATLPHATLSHTTLSHWNFPWVKSASESHFLIWACCTTDWHVTNEYTLLELECKERKYLTPCLTISFRYMLNITRIKIGKWTSMEYGCWGIHWCANTYRFLWSSLITGLTEIHVALRLHPCKGFKRSLCSYAGISLGLHPLTQILCLFILFCIFWFASFTAMKKPQIWITDFRLGTLQIAPSRLWASFHWRTGAWCLCRVIVQISNRKCLHLYWSHCLKLRPAGVHW